ncbi:hypothetical protein ACUNIV_24800, partial [Serratia sp. IR-2025]
APLYSEEQINPWINFQPLGWISFAPLVTSISSIGTCDIPNGRLCIKNRGAVPFGKMKQRLSYAPTAKVMWS